MSRQTRVRAFEERAGWDPAELVVTPNTGSYIAIHPMSDEEHLLKALGQKPEDCVRVDCYWRVNGDVHFVQLDTSAHASQTVGLYVRNEMSNAYAFNFVLIVDQPMIGRATLERGLAEALRVLREGISPGSGLSQIS